eukprot:1093776_1
MSSNLSFLSHGSLKGVSILFSDPTLTNTKLWDLFDFLLWRVEQTRTYSVDSLIDWLRAIICHGEGFKETFCCASHKFVCGQTIKTGDPIYRCRTCQSDNNTLLCVDCFKHSNHDGHDWFATYTNGSGCCDCGDPLSWDPKGFCTKHPGPSAGDSIQIAPNIESIARLLSGYIIYLISHALHDHHNTDDVMYISAYKPSKNACFLKSFQNCHPLKQKHVQNNTNNPPSNTVLSQLMNSPLWGLFNRNDASPELAQIVSALQQEAQTEIDEKNDDSNAYDDDDIKQFETQMHDIKVIQRDYCAFKAMQKESKCKDKYLFVTAKARADAWDEPMKIIRSVLDCTDQEATEIAWKLRMCNTAIIAVGDEDTMHALQQKWIESDANDQYEVEVKGINKDYCRVISRGLLMRLIQEISNWCNDSEILKRILAEPMMANMNHLSPDYDGFKPKGTLKLEPPPCKESENAFYVLILHDHVLSKKYLPFLSNLWYPLITLPTVKHRVSQIMATVYQLLCRTYGETKRSSRHQFLGLTVQFLTIDPIVEICQTHDLFTIVLDTYMKLTCPPFDDTMDSMKAFTGHETQFKTDWEIATKPGANHVVFDQRYLLSVDVMMEYLVFNTDDTFWRRYVMMMAVIQNSLCTHRRHTDHIEFEDRNIINYLRFELNMFFANQRVMLNGLYQCITRHKQTDKYTKGLDLLIDIMYYGLRLIDKTTDNPIVLDETEQKEADDVGEIKMKLSNFDGGYLNDFAYFRTDRDRVSLVLPLSRFIMNISALYTEITSESFEQLMRRLFDKYSDKDSHLNAYISNWIDYSLRFITIFDQFHADLWIKNGDTFRTTIYNYERSDFCYVFYGAQFSLLQSFAVQIMSPSNLLTLILHRYCLHNWFALNEVAVSAAHSDLNTYDQTGWKHWCDARRTLKMVNYVLHTIIAIISEPQYCLLLEEVNDSSLCAKYNAVIRYELIQWLILSPASMTELASKIFVQADSESDREEKLRVILNDIALYQAPKSMEDTGKFVLKKEYYAQFNPYFKKYDRFNPGFIQSSSDEQSEATEKYLKCMTQSTKQRTDRIMFPNWPKQLISFSNDYQLRLLAAPYMGLVWNCTLYHWFINDDTRYTVEQVQQCLRLVSMAVQVLKDSRWDLQCEDSIKLIQNFTKCFDFRLSNKFDHVTDDNKDELMTTKPHKNRNKNAMKEEDDDSDDDEDEHLVSSKQSKSNLVSKHQTNEANEEGIGSVLWFLCKIYEGHTSSTDNDENDGDISMDNQSHHIAQPQRLLIEEIVKQLFSLKIERLMAVMGHFNVTCGTNEAKDNENTLSRRAKRKRKRGKKAQARMMAKMKAKKQRFASKHSTSIMADERWEAQEEKERSELFGIGVDHCCIVCKSCDNQDTMLMMGLVAKCSLLHRCVDNPGNTGGANKEEDILPTRRGLHFSFCGHFVHQQCYDRFIMHSHREDYTLNAAHLEYTCPYCKTVANIVVPLKKVYRNADLNADKFAAVSPSGARVRLQMSDIDLLAANDWFLRTLLWINNDYCDVDDCDATFVYVNAVSYTVSWFEVVFGEDPSALPRNLSLMNTFVCAAWSRCRCRSQYVSQEVMFAHSWGFKFENELFEDPFIRLICGFLSHPRTFDDGDSLYDAKGETTLDFCELILSCYMIQLTQLLLAFAIDNRGKDDEYWTYDVSQWQSLLDSVDMTCTLVDELNDKMSIFLRKSLIVYNAFFAVDDMDELQLLMNDNDLICDLLHVPTIAAILPQCWHDEYLSIMNIAYVLRLTRHMNVGSKMKMQLCTLPTDYNTLFEIAAHTKCSKKGIAAIKSGMCLLCGKRLCIDCCKKSVIDHCRDCNHGIGCVLYFQNSSIILMWNDHATQYESVFLDKYGESDCGLWRGVQLQFNQQRYDQLKKLISQHRIQNKMTQIRKTRRDLLERRLDL